MGNRANFVIVEDQDWQLFYSHWAGYRMLDALIGGPDGALRFFRSLRRCEKDEWVDPLWADGGAVVDLDRRRLLFFGDELMVSMNERRAMLSVLATIWSDYAVGWAYDGPRELTSYVGAHLGPTTWVDAPEPRLCPDLNALCHIVSVVDQAGRLRLWALWWGVSEAWHGPAILQRLPRAGSERLTLNTIPAGGVHVDESQKRVGVWQAADTAGIFVALPQLWDGWETQCWEDRFELQVAQCRDALRIPEVDMAAGADSARVWIAGRVRPDDGPAYAPLIPDADAWRRFAEVCGALGGQHAA